MKKITLIAASFLFSNLLFAQDDLLNMLGDGSPEKEPVTATFKTTRLLNGHSVEQVAERHLDFRIGHRFGLISDGFSNLYGIDNADIRLSLEYGLTDWCMLGISRNNYGEKAWEYFGKFRILRQTKSGSMPLSLSFLGTAAFSVGPSEQNLTNRGTYCWQAILARKFNDAFSLQLSPTVLHRNLRPDPSLKNDLYSLGIGGRIKISKRTSFNAEYFLRFDPSSYFLNDQNNTYRNSLSIGFDIETGGHVFQLHVSNSQGLIEKDFISGTNNSWQKGNIVYGFNISRVFSFN